MVNYMIELGATEFDKALEEAKSMRFTEIVNLMRKLKN